MKNNIEKELKKFLKRRVKINESILVAFLITGFFCSSIDISAAVVTDDTTGKIVIGDTWGAGGTANSLLTNSILIANGRTTGGYGGWIGGNYNMILSQNVGRDTTGNYNLVVGDYARENSSGNYNFFLGEQAGKVSNGNYNVGIGNLAGYGIGSFNRTEGGVVRTYQGSNNFFVGEQAGGDSKGFYNVGFGYKALQADLGTGNKKTEGNYNVAFGSHAGLNTVGDENYSFGNHAGREITGIKNYSFGESAGRGTKGNYNFAFGEHAGQRVTGFDGTTKSTYGWSNFAFGKAAGSDVIGNHNIAFGENAGQFVGYRHTDNAKVDGAEHNISFGYQAGQYIAGQDNFAAGVYAGQKVIGESNIALGKGSGGEIVGRHNTAISPSAGQKVTGDANIALGVSAGTEVTGSNNIAIGQNAGEKIIGKDNVTIGRRTKATSIETKDESISIGAEAVAKLTRSIALGYGAQSLNKEAIAIGEAAVANINRSIALGDSTTTIATADTRTKGTDNTYTTTTISGTNPLTLSFAGGNQVVGVVGVGNATETRRIQNVAPGLLSANSTDAVNGSQLYALADKVATISATTIDTDTYFHTNTGSPTQGAGNATTNLGKITEKAGATGTGALTAGLNTRATGEKAVAIGNGAIAGQEAAIAIGDRARVTVENGAGKNGIAIGQNARSHNMANARHEDIITFGRNKAELSGGIAIGEDTHSRIGTVELGNRDYRGEIGDFTFSTVDGRVGSAAATLDNWDITSGVGTTAVGDNSFALGNFQSISGAYSIISKSTDKLTSVGSQLDRGLAALRNAGGALQGFGATIQGSLNSIEANENLTGNMSALFGADHVANGLMYSGMVSSIVGVANRVNKSNGALIFGTGNEITNSYLTPNSPAIIDQLSTSVPFLGTLTVNATLKANSVSALSNTFRTYIKDNRLASVGIIGGANKVDYALFSTISGVGNTLSGQGGVALNNSNTELSNATANANIFSSFNSISGYENKAKVITHGMISGASNEVEFAEKNIVQGNNNVLKGNAGNIAKGNIILGFNTIKDADDIAIGIDDAVAIGNDTKLGGNKAIAIGKDAKALAENSISIGNGNKVDGKDSGAFGDPSVISGVGSYGFGNDNAVGATSTDVTSLGNNNQIGATATYNAAGKLDLTAGIIATAAVQNSKVVGNKNYVNTSNTYVMGSGIGVKDDGTVIGTVENSVYLGNDSTVAVGAAVGTANLTKDGIVGTTTTAGNTGTVTSATVNGINYSGFAGATSNGAVTVGSAGEERRIMNVAAGEISATSTDAINGSQLYAVADKIKTDISNQVIAAKTEVIAGTNVEIETIAAVGSDPIKYKVNADGTTVSSADSNYIVVNKGTKNTTTNITDYSIDLSQTVKAKIDSISASASEKETVVAGSTNLTVNDSNKNSTGGKEFVVDLAKDINISSVTTGNTKMDTNGIVINNGPSMTKDGVDAGGQKITNVAAGTAPTDAVNVSQLKGIEQNIDNRIDNRIDNLDQSTRRGIAGAMAQAGVRFQEQGVNQVVLGAAASFYKGQGAVAVGVQGAPSENTRIHTTISATPGSNMNTAVTIGASWKLNLK